MFSAKLSPQHWFSAEFCYSLCQQKSHLVSLTPDSIVVRESPSLHASAENIAWQPVPMVAPREHTASLIVTCEGLSLEKVYQVYSAIQPHVVIDDIQMRAVGVGKAVAKLRLVEGDLDTIREEIEQLCQQFQVEIALLQSAPDITKPGILLMDMDSTVIQVECIDEIARLADIGDEVAEVTELAMQGKLDFTESLYQRVACLKGIDENLLQGIRDRLPLMPGIISLLDTLKQNGWIVAIASGGFTYFADYLKQRLGLDYAVSNTLDIQSGKLTGKVNGAVVDAVVKAQTLEKLMLEHGIDRQQTIAIGDGANDLKMMQVANLGVAYHAKPIVSKQASCAIRYSGLDTVLAYLV